MESIDSAENGLSVETEVHVRLVWEGEVGRTGVQKEQEELNGGIDD